MLLLIQETSWKYASVVEGNFVDFVVAWFSASEKLIFNKYLIGNVSDHR